MIKEAVNAEAKESEIGDENAERENEKVNYSEGCKTMQIFIEYLVQQSNTTSTDHLSDHCYRKRRQRTEEVP